MHVLMRAYRASKSLKEASENDGAKGALKGALGVAGTVAATSALVGYGLTPAGWVTFGALGAAAGGTGAIKKARSWFS